MNQAAMRDAESGRPAPDVSIIIPIHNAGNWLAATLASLGAQSCRSLEIILIDDGSTDDSWQIASAFAAGRQDTRLVSQPNRGASAARNHGLRLARGRYVQFLDADDLIAPDKIELQLRLLSRCTDRIVVSGAWARFTTEAQTARFLPMPNWRDMTGVEFIQVNFEHQTMMHPGAWLVPRSLIEQTGGWEETLSLNDDGEFFARVALAADRIVFCADARSYYRSNLSTSLSGRRDRAALESLFRSIELITTHLLRADAGPRSRAAAAYAWKWTAFELYPMAGHLSERAWGACKNLGGSTRPFPAGRRFQLLARVFGWRFARRLTVPRVT